ncbi:hypothetical protein [Aquirhabdus sp.]|uniref:hypothetical protein n=1 Tax=Aquirhabdus sp. TaxID=2824160 RepID=UPI00396C40B5
MKNRTIHLMHPHSVSRLLTWAFVLIGSFMGASIPAYAGTALNHLGYVPVSSTGSVDVIDLVQQKVLKKITGVGEHPTVLRALSDRSKIYVDNFGPLSSQIAVINTTSNTVVKKITTHGLPFAAMQLSPDGHFLYVPTTNSVMDVIDTQSDTIIRSLPLPALPLGVEVSSDGMTLYVTFNDDTVGAFDALSGAVVHAPINVAGRGPGWATPSLDGKKLYIANFLTDNIAVLDTVNWTIVNSIHVGLKAEPISVTLTPDGKALYVCNVGTRNITIINTQTESITKTIPRLTIPIVVGFSPDSSRAYLSDLGLATLTYGIGAFTGLAFFAYTPGLPSDIVTLDAATGKAIGQPVFTETGIVLGVYF